MQHHAPEHRQDEKHSADRRSCPTLGMEHPPERCQQDEKGHMHPHLRASDRPEPE